MEKVYKAIERLINYAEKNLGLDKRNEDYVRNGIFRLFGLDSYSEETAETDEATPEKLLREFTEAGVNAGIFTAEESAYYCDAVMGELMLMPKDVQDKFSAMADACGNKQAMTWFYDYCVKGDYVKKAQLERNPRFDAEGLVVTINKAKPEFRDPKKAVSGNSTKGGYPKCSICRANEGFAGRSKRTLRTLDITLGGEKWFWQFSPYGYFSRHGIAVNQSHTPMHVDETTFAKLMDFVDTFPHYFIGCNAPLPRIGGSVLAHDHYQGGGEILPMHKAKAIYTLKNRTYPDAVVEVVDWRGTVVRVVSENRRSIEKISSEIMNKWNGYDNPSLGIIHKDADGVHNAVSPTVVKTERGYEMSIILRSNITSKEFPDGVFHAHPEYHMIKKESIGLIEAQGLFILPGRLEEQLGALQKLIEENRPLPEEMSDFRLIYDEVKAMDGGVHSAVRKVLGSICNRILENTAVFKNKEQTVEFMKELGFGYDK